VAGFAQDPAQGPRGGQMKPYDASKEETIKGKVVSVSEVQSGPQTLVCLSVLLDGKEWQLALAPPDYMKEKNVSFAQNDEIAIQGYKTQTLRGPIICAREVSKGDIALLLLNKDGKSTWGPHQEKGEGGSLLKK
jgi:hypothetical protein